MLLAGRMTLGLAIGVTSATVPMYVAETAPPHVRGALVTANDLMICGGQVSAAVPTIAIRTSLKELSEGPGWSTRGANSRACHCRRSLRACLCRRWRRAW